MSACSGETASLSASSSISSAETFASARACGLVHERAVERLQRAQRVAERGSWRSCGSSASTFFGSCGSRSTDVSEWMSRSGQISGAGVSDGCGCWKRWRTWRAVIS